LQSVSFISVEMAVCLTAGLCSSRLMLSVSLQSVCSLCTLWHLCVFCVHFSHIQRNADTYTHIEDHFMAIYPCQLVKIF